MWLSEWHLKPDVVLNFTAGFVWLEDGTNLAIEKTSPNVHTFHKQTLE